MKLSHVPLLETGYFSGLTGLYLQGAEELREFYNLPFSINNFSQAITAREKIPINRQLLYEVLRHQHANYFVAYPELLSAINAIPSKQTYTITTGHQLCTATGPLYMIYKIASAINLCRQLQAELGTYRFIPVFWMASEDHDFEEINHIHLFNKKIEWQTSTQGATGRIGNEGLQPFFDLLKQTIGHSISNIDLYQIIEEAYTKHQTLSDATRDMLLNIFGKEGLLVLDADDIALKNSFKQIVKEDMINQCSFTEVNKSIHSLVTSGLIKEDKIQVKPREINFFYMKEHLRKRIVVEHELYKVLDTDIAFDKNSLINEIDQFPERFSPNVVMRPVYQEFILPNLCYIGGAGELSYWLELKSTFDAHHVFYPMLALRKSLLWVDHKQAEKLSSLNISVAELFQSAESLVESLLNKLGVNAIDFSAEKNAAYNMFEALKNNISKIDATLVASVGVEQQKLIKSIEMLEHKAEKAQKNKHEISINQIKKIKENLFPAGGLQERNENILWLNLKYGKGLIQQIIDLCQLDDACLTIVTLDEQSNV